MAKKQGFLTVEGFTETLTKYEKSMIHLLNSKYGIPYEEFVETCITAVKKTPKLLYCDRSSLIGCVLLSASVGLKPNTPDQHCFIIPRGEEATFQMGYQGLVEIMYRNPRVKKITAEVVYKKDEFDYTLGLNPSLSHKPYRGVDKGEVDAVYCIVKLEDAEPIFTVVESHVLKEIEKFAPMLNTDNAAYSPYKNGKDIHNFMQIKAGIKKISKLIPKQDAHALGLAIDLDSKFEGGSKIRIDLDAKEGELVSPEFVQGDESNKSLQQAFSDQESEDILNQVKENVENLQKEKATPNTDTDKSETKNQEAKKEPATETTKSDIGKNSSEGDVQFEDFSEDFSDNPNSEYSNEISKPVKDSKKIEEESNESPEGKKATKKTSSKKVSKKTENKEIKDKSKSKQDAPVKESSVEESKTDKVKSHPPTEKSSKTQKEEENENLFDLNDDDFDFNIDEEAF